MKIIWYFLSCLVCLTSCSDELTFQENVKEPEKALQKSEIIDVVTLKKDFGKTLAKVLYESLELRTLIKNEALKQIDYDYDVLYFLIKDTQLENGVTFEQSMRKYLSAEKISLIEKLCPTLTIFVPTLPENSFSALDWDTSSEIPSVAIRTCISNDVPMYDYTGKETTIASDIIPGFPIVVIKENERITTNSYTKSFNGLNNMITTKAGLTFSFTDEVFNNTNPKPKSKFRSRWSDPEFPNQVQKSFDAYNIFGTNDGWQRDYIYYDITHTTQRGRFNLNYKECLCYFQMQPPAQTAFNKISDQTGDPELKYGYVTAGTHSNRTTPWTDGEFEFLVKTYLANKQGTASEFVFNFRASADDLFTVVYESIGNRSFKVKNIGSCNEFKLKRPLFEWNLENYSPTVKISIEEKDGEETQRSQTQTSTEFAANFEFNAKLGESEKVGLKFGSSMKQIVTTTYERTTTLGNDELGDVIVNFGDPVVLAGDWIKTPSGRDVLYTLPYNSKYSNGWYKIGILPLKMND